MLECVPREEILTINDGEAHSTMSRCLAQNTYKTASQASQPEQDAGEATINDRNSNLPINKSSWSRVSFESDPMGGFDKSQYGDSPSGSRHSLARKFGKFEAAQRLSLAEVKKSWK